MGKIDTNEKQKFTIELGNNVAEYRHKRGLTLRELAQLTGYTRGYLGLIEKANSVPNSFVIKKISDALNVPISALYGEKEAINNIKGFNDPILNNEDNKEYLNIIKKAISKKIPANKVKKAIYFVSDILEL
ncbi:MAG: helix-turn-helix domain-containing protein [archaeon]